MSDDNDLLSVEEWRALIAEQDIDYTPNNDANNLLQARTYLAKLEGDSYVEPDHEDVRCLDCNEHAPYAWTYGKTIVCRKCRRNRIRVAVMNRQPLPEAAEKTFAKTLIEQAERWVVAAVHTKQVIAAIEHELRRRHIPETYIYVLIDHAYDLRREADKAADARRANTIVESEAS